MSRKNFSLIAVILIIIIFGVGGYFFLRLKKSTYPASSFVSLSYKWGTGDSLVNSYDSSTGKYQYLDSRDSLIKKHITLRANNVIFLHSKANEFGLWELPDVIANKNADLKSNKILRYEMIFNYEKKSKKIIYLTDYDGNPTIADSAEQLQATIKQVLDEIEERFGK